MNCIRCGKEITDGRRKICKECAEKEKKEKEEKKAQKNVEKKEKVENKKNSENNKSKENKSENSKFKNKKFYIFCVIIAVIAILVVALIILSSNKGNNTIGNIRNYGYATSDGNYIYYVAPNSDSSAIGIFKTKKDGTGDSEELFMEDIEVLSLNVYKGNIYFIGISTESYSSDNDKDNKIYKMTTNGDNLTIVNDNEFNDNCDEIYVINGSIYYIGTDSNIYKMDLDGSNRTLVLDNGTGYLGITEDYIIYNKEVDSDEGSSYTTYIMNIDGSDQRPIIDGERLNTVNIKDDYVYYTNSDKQIYKTKIDSGVAELLLDTTAYNTNLYGDYVYFLNYKDIENEDNTVCLFRIKTDGSETEATNIKELDTYSIYINIVGDWVIYMDSNDTEGFINMVKTDGSDEKCLYLLNYEEYYNSVSTTEDEETVEETAEETTEETTTTENSTTQTTENVVSN